jgi:hypothetical protein
MGSEIRNMQMRNQQFAQSWYKQQRLIDQFKFAYEQEQRRAFWDNNRGPTWDRNSKLKHWFELHEARRSTGNPVADRMFALHDGLMNALNRWDQSHGFTYNLRESYIYHALKNPERDLPALENKIRQMRWGDPDFMHPRQIPTIEMLHALGFELQTYNLEDIDQMRLEASSRAEFKAKSLENLREAHLAFTQDDLVAMQARMLNAFHAAGRIPPKNFEAQAKTFFDKLKEQTDLWRSPRAKGPGDKHETYFVHKEASWMLHRATDPVIWHPALGGFVTFAQSLKQRTTGLNLGWSALHQLHMLSIGAAQTTTLVMRKFVEGTGNLGDLAKAIADTVTLGGFSHIKSLYHNQALLNWYQTGDPQFLHNLTPFEREMLELHEEGGFIPSISHERQIQIERLLSLRNRQITFETLRNRPVSLALDLGYALLSARPYQQWLFGRVIPSLKQYAYDAQALALKEARPDLWRPQNTLQRRIELRKIRDLVDIRFGEQNLRQSFADPHIKAFGQAVLLSYSWNKSMIETYGGAIHDIEKASSSDFLKAIREEGLRPASERFLTNRLIYGLMLTGFSAASNMMIASLLGDGVQSGQDLIYPNIGKGPDGKLKRVKPPQWLTTDLFGLMKDVAQEGAFWPGFLVFAGNKMQASLSTLYNIWGRGKDYFGNDIADEEKIKASLQQLLPFMAQQGLQPGMTPRDIILGMLGLPPAPKSASRTAGENLIMNLYTQYHVPRGTEAYVHQQIQAREEYRQALLARNQTAAQTAVQKMKGLGMTEKAIRNVEQNLHTSTAELHFKHSLDADEQARVLREMQGDELKRYWHLAKPEARHKYEQPDPSERPGLIKYIPEWIP